MHPALQPTHSVMLLLLTVFLTELRKKVCAQTTEPHIYHQHLACKKDWLLQRAKGKAEYH